MRRGSALLLMLLILPILASCAKGTSTPAVTGELDRFPVMEVVYENGAILHREVKDFDAFLKETTQPVFLDFWADWCPPCKASAPFVELLAKDYQGRARILKIDVDIEGDIAAAYKVSAIPQFNVVKNGKTVGTQPGYAESIEPALRKMIDQAID